MSAPRTPDPGPLLGASPAMDEVRTFLARAAEVDVPVLIEGETGTGKSHVAQLLHHRGPRREAPFISVNCAGVPDGLFESEFFGHRRGAFTGASESRPGLFEQASEGTLFLDEVGELPLHQQAKLLAVLEDGRVRRVGGTRTRPVDVRIVAATCRDLGGAVRDGSFRADLYHRLALLRCEVPPLRRRAADLDGMVAHFLEAAGSRHAVEEPKLAPGCLDLLRRHTWPGNVRELAHALEAAVILADGATVGRELLAQILSRSASLSPAAGSRRAGEEAAAPGGTATEPGGATGGPAAVAGGAPGAAAEASAATVEADGHSRERSGGRYSFYGTPDEEKGMIQEALARHRGNRTRTARELGMSRNTLRNRMREYGI